MFRNAESCSRIRTGKDPVKSMLEVGKRSTLCKIHTVFVETATHADLPGWDVDHWSSASFISDFAVQDITTLTHSPIGDLLG